VLAEISLGTWLLLLHSIQLFSWVCPTSMLHMTLGIFFHLLCLLKMQTHPHSPLFWPYHSTKNVAQE
jgi:hypothetical protein